MAIAIIDLASERIFTSASSFGVLIDKEHKVDGLEYGGFRGAESDSVIESTLEKVRMTLHRLQGDIESLPPCIFWEIGS